MKRLETLVRQARADLRDNEYLVFNRNGATETDIARALDRLRESEAVLRRAYEKEGDAA